MPAFDQPVLSTKVQGPRCRPRFQGLPALHGQRGEAGGPGTPAATGKPVGLFRGLCGCARSRRAGFVSEGLLQGRASSACLLCQDTSTQPPAAQSSATLCGRHCRRCQPGSACREPTAAAEGPAAPPEATIPGRNLSGKQQQADLPQGEKVPKSASLPREPSTEELLSALPHLGNEKVKASRQAIDRHRQFDAW